MQSCRCPRYEDRCNKITVKVTTSFLHDVRDVSLLLPVSLTFHEYAASRRSCRSPHEILFLVKIKIGSSYVFPIDEWKDMHAKHESLKKVKTYLSPLAVLVVRATTKPTLVSEKHLVGKFGCGNVGVPQNNISESRFRSLKHGTSSANPV